MKCWCPMRSSLMRTTTGADVIEPGRLTAEEETELIAAKAAASVLLDGPEAVLPPRQARARVNPRFGSP